MPEFAMDDAVTYQDLEPLIEAEVNDPLPEGLVDPSWLELPALEQDWLELPEIDPTWLELPALEKGWLQGIDQGEPEQAFDVPDPEHGGEDVEH